MIISHRGNDNHKYNENTLLAIQSSLNKNYIDGVEFDVRLTKDKKIVLNHNFISNGKIIKYTKYKELNLDKLNDILKRIRSNKILLIEVKDNNQNLFDLLYKVIKKYKYLNIYIISFYKKAIINFKRKYPDVKVGIILFKLNNENYDLFDIICVHYLGYKKINKPIFVWTINNKEKQKKFINMNINIITDKPYLVK